VKLRVLTIWIIAMVLVCAALGAWAGHHIGAGGPGNIALIAATCAVLGSFVPNAVVWAHGRLRGRRRAPGPIGRRSPAARSR
jgi:hypothetical protein